jgi:class 3 adenylate cyclase
MRAELPSGTVTFLFTDIEGSTARWEGHPEAMRVALARHDTLVRAAIVEHHGHVVKTTGDGFHAAFARAPDALAAGLARRVTVAVDESSIPEKAMKWVVCIECTAYSRT